MDTKDTAFDFQTEKALAEVFASDFEQKNLCNGLDHPFFLKESNLDIPAAKLTSPDGKIELSVSTDSSSVVIFTANFGDEGPEIRGKKLANHGELHLRHKSPLVRNNMLPLVQWSYLPMNPLKQLLNTK